MTEASALVTRLRMRLDRAEGMRALDETVLKHGYVGGHPYSFKDHEYQQKIIQDPSSRIAARKCSQVGFSEVMVQKTLALCVALNYVRIIYTLPTLEFANKFSKDRFDGAIEQSPTYKGMVKSASNSASQKQIGTNMLYIGGAHSDSSAISIPAEVVINDEVDFSDATVVGKLSSRLRHAEMVDSFGQRGIRYLFSTPTTDGTGIDLPFLQGTQSYYAVKCEHCETWQIPNFRSDFVIPGFDDDVKNFSKEDAVGLDLKDVKIVCPACRRDLQPSLLDSSRRGWVEKYPGRPQKSYQVSPWDVPKYNTPFQIVNQILDYPLKSDYYNFVLGIPYSDSTNTFNVTEVFKQKQKRADFVQPVLNSTRDRPEGRAPFAGRCVIGMDVGKVCHLSVIIPDGRKLVIPFLTKIRNERESPGLPEILAIHDFFQPRRMVIDAGPDISLVNALTKARPATVVACVYTALKGPRLLQSKLPKEPVVNADRTKALTLLLNRHNSGDILYPKNDAMTNLAFAHIGTTKKIRRPNADGSFTEMFVASSKEDHFLHSINYASIAAEMEFGMNADEGIPAPVSVGVAGVGSNHKIEVVQPGQIPLSQLKRFFVW